MNRSEKTQDQGAPVAKMQLPIEAHPNFKYVIEAMEAIKTRYPGGAINQLDTQTRLNLSQADVELEFFKISSFVFFMKLATKPIEFDALAQQSHALQYAVCTTMVDYAIAFLRNKYEYATNKAGKPLLEALILDAHQVLLIGRAPHLKTKNIDKWDSEAIIFDPWANEYYYANQFINKQKAKTVIPFYTRGQSLDCYELKECVIPYLQSAHPKIVIGKKNEKYDHSLDAWFHAEARLRAASHAEPTGYLTTASMFHANTHTAEMADNQELIKTFNQFTPGLNWRFKKDDKGVSVWVVCDEEAVASKIEGDLKSAVLVDMSISIALVHQKSDRKPVVMVKHPQSSGLLKYITSIVEEYSKIKTIQGKQPPEAIKEYDNEDGDWEIVYGPT